MALVSREVASYPMQGAVERPPAPTLSPIPNPFLSLFASLCPSSSVFALWVFVVFSHATSFSSVQARSSSIGLPPLPNTSNYRNPTFETKGGPFSENLSASLLFSLSTAVIFHTGSYSFSQVHEILADHRLSSDYQFRYTRNRRRVEKSCRPVALGIFFQQADRRTPT